MSDCADRSGEFRDLLPELAAGDGAASGRLTPEDRARLLGHLATCADCREEVELLRAARGDSVATAPSVDVGRIVQALPHPPTARRAIRVERRRYSRTRWSAWPMAAAVSTIAIAGLSVAVVRGVNHGGAHVGAAGGEAHVGAAGGEAQASRRPPAR